MDKLEHVIEEKLNFSDMETEDGEISNVLELRKILKQKMVCM